MDEQHLGCGSQLPRVSRRRFIGLAALASLLAGCDMSQRTVTPTIVATSGPSATATAVATAGPAATPTLRPVPPRPAVIKFYPDGPSQVLRTRHAGVWDGDNLAPRALREMLDASITRLTGLNDAQAAWAALFASKERIAIKVNSIYPDAFQCTHLPLVMAVAACLQEVGVPPEQIIIFDRFTNELEGAGYAINRDRPGVRCHGTDDNYVAGWTLLDSDIRLSGILLGCDALINMPILKHHEYSGVTFAQKNHYGTVENPYRFHPPRMERAIAELNALPAIKDRTRLIIGDMLEICPYSATYGRWHQTVRDNAILMSFDPVAHDAVGLQMLVDVMERERREYFATIAAERAGLWLKASTEMGLGTRDPAEIELVEVYLG